MANEDAFFPMKLAFGMYASGTERMKPSSFHLTTLMYLGDMFGPHVNRTKASAMGLVGAESVGFGGSVIDVFGLNPLIGTTM